MHIHKKITIHLKIVVPNNPENLKTKNADLFNLK